MLDLGYPGGPIVEKMAKDGDENRFDFTIPLINSPKLAFSYSGLKNQVRLAIADFDKDISYQDKCDICASFQRVAVEHLLHKLKKIFKRGGIKDFSIVGGASANLYLRRKVQKLCDEFGATLHLAKLEYCSDNAVMIGRYGIEAYHKREFTPYDKIDSNPKIFRN
jgi:N6-L-threonylcarbamoyladenine synthase